MLERGDVVALLEPPVDEGGGVRAGDPRHQKRRLIQTDSLEDFARVLKPGGTLRFAMTQLNPSLPKSGTGTLTILKTNTFGGTIFLSGGTLAVGNAGTNAATYTIYPKLTFTPESFCRDKSFSSVRSRSAAI